MKSKTLRFVSGAVVLASLCLSSSAAFGQVFVYSNAFTRLNQYYAPGTAQFGDEIILSGGAGQPMTGFQFEYVGLGLSGNETVTLRFYLNNGAQVIGGSIPAFKPNTKFYDSGPISLSAVNPPSGNTPSDGKTLRFTLPVGDPNLIIPNNNFDFTWTVQFGGLENTGEVAGLDLYNPVNLGGNYNDFWQQDPISLDWELRQDTSATPVPMNFGAVVSAVPEASPLQIGLLAGAVFLGWSIYRRRTATA